MSLRTLEPWERRVWRDREEEGRRAAEAQTSQWRPMSPLQLRQEIERLRTNFRTNWKEIAYLQGAMRVVDERFKGKKQLGENLKGYLEATRSKSLKEWL